MKYFFVLDTNHKRHIVIAKELSDVEVITKDSNLKIDYAYELVADTFTSQGFLISDK